MKKGYDLSEQVIAWRETLLGKKRVAYMTGREHGLNNSPKDYMFGDKRAQAEYLHGYSCGQAEYEAWLKEQTP